MKIDVWSDVVCPFCYIGKRRLERGLEASGLDATVVWHSFELDPGAPPSHDQPLVELIGRKYGLGPEQAVRAQERVAAMAAIEGIRFNWRVARHGNTFDAHRLLHLAADRGRGDAVGEALFHAYFTEGRLISDHAVLHDLGVGGGLDAAEVDDTLASDRYADAVRHDEALAHRIGITGVPFFVVDGVTGISGAQPLEVFESVLRQAATDREAAGATDGRAAGNRSGTAGNRSGAAGDASGPTDDDRVGDAAAHEGDVSAI